MPPHVRAHRVTPGPPRWLVACLMALVATLAGGVGSGPLGAEASGPSASMAPAPAVVTADGPIVLGETVTFFGRGYGHGVGMSQYGARGRALAGQDATAILAHYYQGATLGSISAATPIRVLLLSKWRSTPKTPLVVYGRRTSWKIDGIGATFPVDAKLRLTPTTTVTKTGTRTTWRIRVNAPNGRILYDGPKPASLVLRGTTGSGVLELWPKPRSYDTYRGALRLITASTAPTVTVVNELRLELYLAGVVPAEMPSTWPAAALAAQAIAARSYAARHLRPGVSFYDVPDDSSSQIYRGLRGERPVTNAIVKSTAGVVLKSGSSIADALFHSTGGGATEDNENVFNSATGAKIAGPLSYLRGSADRDAAGVPYDAAAPYATWQTKPYPVAELSAWFAADARTDVGALTALDLDDRGVSGRLISVTLIGSDGTKTVSGNVFRSVFDDARPAADPMLRSTLFATAPIP